MSAERTEAPTPKRLKEARDRGDVARSEEVVSIGVLLAGVLALRVLGPALWNDMRDLLYEGLGHPTGEELTPQSTQRLGEDSFWSAISMLLPLLGVLAAGAVIFNVAQTGLLLSGTHLKPQVSRVNPGSGLKRLASKEALVRLAKSLAKFGVVGAVVYATLAGQMAELTSLGDAGVADGTARLASLGFDIALRSSAALFVMALLDYAWQKRQHLSRLRMTKQEVKQELRESDGDPQVKAAIRRRRQQLMNRMMAAVKTADVVVTNPTHFAVALKYDPVTMQAPMVVAKGQDQLALRMREIARKAGVPVLEEPPLARALYRAAQPGQYVPANLFHAVAEVLAWVYALRAKKPFARRRTASVPGGLE